jgi:hypothetical protein
METKVLQTTDLFCQMHFGRSDRKSQPGINREIRKRQLAKDTSLLHNALVEENLETPHHGHYRQKKRDGPRIDKIGYVFWFSLKWKKTLIH